MLEKLMDSPIAWTFLAVLAVVSFIYAIICQQLNKERKEFSYCIKSNVLIRKKKSKFEKLRVTYDGKQIEDLCISKLTIWNSGNKTLVDTDMVESKELTISLEGNNTILDVEFIACSEETNKFSFKVVDEYTIKLYFDYADKKDGIVIQIIHTGIADNLHIDCKIKGGKTIKRITNNDITLKIFGIIHPMDVWAKASIVIMGIMTVFALIYLIVCVISIFDVSLRNIIFTSTSTLVESPEQTKTTAIVMSVTMFAITGLYSIVYIPMVKKAFKVGIPKTLKKHSDF